MAKLHASTARKLYLLQVRERGVVRLQLAVAQPLNPAVVQRSIKEESTTVREKGHCFGHLRHFLGISALLERMANIVVRCVGVFCTTARAPRTPFRSITRTLLSISSVRNASNRLIKETNEREQLEIP